MNKDNFNRLSNIEENGRKEERLIKLLMQNIEEGYIGSNKPQESYAHLITQAIISSKQRRLPLREIYRWIEETYPYFKISGTKWKNSVRHNLSVYDCFKKQSKEYGNKGSFWTVDLERAGEVIRRNNKKVRRSRGIGKMANESVENYTQKSKIVLVPMEEIDFETGLEIQRVQPINPPIRETHSYFDEEFKGFDCYDLLDLQQNNEDPHDFFDKMFSFNI
ncbi:Fork head domain protein [Spraguea lophii 42_110]|uniref:Fork head domain protein n=1 Tax=Spraguea lophii (strain 42_110) TaxID=1358809 RepID=S7WC44_SPRLO|nr:Fork head domain protein [Spraguea lophii 42_110]